MEYTVLSVCPLTDGNFQVSLHGLLSDRQRAVSTFTHPPSNEKTPIILNGNLHWMVCDKAYKEANGVKADCSNSIVLCNMNSVNFSTIPHPGDQCGLRKKHNQMELMEMEGRLCFCDASLNRNIVIWILEDYEHRIWVKRHVIMVDPLIKFCGIHHSYGSHVNIGGFYIFNNELLLRVSKSYESHVILYNLQLNTSRRVGQERWNVVAVPHTNSLVYLDADVN
ncbi:hypothetical protein IFM89_027179 [Coptis chinensis]|uniref:F-box associated beta-propeller type 3 domain-containing protein n=1 Tax=Coptis chinensis TaxID=261450 RepID=A0A835IG35_9MAGN|nr:hypothetical protein IFM89_027179 [Coptis chinensis]